MPAKTARLSLLAVAFAFCASVNAIQDQGESTFWAELVDADFHTKLENFHPTNLSYDQHLGSRHEAFKRTGLTCIETCKVLLIVITNVERWSKRLVWRYTVGQHLPHGVDLLFPIASARQLSSYSERYLSYERMTFRDVLHLHSNRTKHETTTARYASLLQFLLDTGLHHKYEWFVKVDDDTIVQPQAVLEYFNHMPEHKVLACRSNNREHNFCGGPMMGIRSSYVQRFLEAVYQAGVGNLNWHDDVVASELTEGIFGNKSSICWSPPHFVHEPQNKDTHWSMPVTNTTVAVHLLKPAHAFLAGFIRFYPQVAAWELCRTVSFQLPHCAAWQQAFADVCDPELLPPAAGG